MNRDTFLKQLLFFESNLPVYIRILSDDGHNDIATNLNIGDWNFIGTNLDSNDKDVFVAHYQDNHKLKYIESETDCMTGKEVVYFVCDESTGGNNE